MVKKIKRFNEPVPQEVRDNVSKYLKENNLGELIDVVRHSDHPEDCYLYHVIAKRRNAYWGDTYCCWTSWNETTQSLNYGHYNLISEQEARKISDSFIFRMSGDNVID